MLAQSHKAAGKKPGTTHALKKPFEYDTPFQLRLVRVLYQEVDFTLSVCHYLSHEHFEKRLHRWMAKEILDYAKKHGHGITKAAFHIAIQRGLKPRRIKYRNGTYGKKLPPLLAASDVKEVKALIDGLVKVVKDRSFIKEELYRFVKHQVTREMILRSLDHLDFADYDAVDKEINRVLEVATIDQGGVGHFYVRDVDERVKKRREEVANGIPTGLKVDEYLRPGGLPKGAIGVVLAATNVGKSKALVNIGKAAIVEGGAKVLHITLEDSEDDILDNYDACFSHVQLSALKDKPKKIRRTVDEYGTKHGEFLVVKEFPGATLTVPMLEQYLKLLERAGFVPDMVIIDYADEMLPTLSSGDGDTYKEQGNVYRELARMAHPLRYNVAVWTAAQTNRSALDAEVVDLNNMGDSFKKAQKAHLVLALCQTEEEQRGGFGRVLIAKNKFGPKKISHRVRFDWNRCIWRNV